ncbi:MAG: shikimate kinase [Firmicutes bacterium]|nr:shikimate kinase [Bacillota bacterium]
MEEKIYGLIGRNLKHSYSVPVHRELGNSAYRLIELEPEELASFLAREDLGGVNVTMPYKRAVIRYCDRLSPEAQETGSVNTIVRTAAGTLEGFNTDAFGLEYMIRRAGISPAGKKVLIFGSGGASLTAQHVARKSGAKEVVVISRSGKENYENYYRHDDAGILINATPLGMYPRTGDAAADASLFIDCSGVLDLIYNPLRTALILQAEALGTPCSGGLPMLTAQAGAAAELFSNVTLEEGEIERITDKLYLEKTSIVLIGMPGSGKNTVGRALSQMSGRELIDIDAAIEKEAGCSIPEIFARSGEAGFRRLERELTAEAGKRSGKIIVTGGGVVKDKRNHFPLRQNGRLYHLRRDPALLPREGRPLSEKADLEAMLEERQPLYERFRDAVIDNCGTPEEAAKAVWRDFNAHPGD